MISTSSNNTQKDHYITHLHRWVFLFYVVFISMKIIITERQQNLLTEKISEDKLRDFCYKIWDKQKEKGEEPHIDDIIYQVSGVEKNTREDFTRIRPIWYEYNGGYMELFNRMKDDILGKTFNVQDSNGNFNTDIRVVNVEPPIKRSYDTVDIYCDVDHNGTMDFTMWDDETDEEYEINDTIDAAYQEALSNYVGGDLTDSVNHYVYEFLNKKLEKYGLPIDVEIDLTEFN